MSTIEPHPHSFPAGSWPFAVSVNTTAFSSAQVVREGAPVLVVCHDHDGEWQFLHGDVTEQDECVLICMGCALQRTPAVAELASLPQGWRASRKDVASPWVSEPYADEA